MDQIPYSEGLRHCCPPDHISHITYSMEYGVCNRDYYINKNCDITVCNLFADLYSKVMKQERQWPFLSPDLNLSEFNYRDKTSILMTRVFCTFAANDPSSKNILSSYKHRLL